MPYTTSIAGTKSIAATKTIAATKLIANDINTLAKAIKELNDPLLKKFLSDCLIQYTTS